METNDHNLYRLPTLIALLVATLICAVGLFATGCGATQPPAAPEQAPALGSTPHQSPLWQDQQAAQMWHLLDRGLAPQPKPSDVPQSVWDSVTQTANQITKDGQ